ncbi:MAG: basic secretory family protein [Nitrososphaerota archaeon]|uniref:hypothetical protein n=1 Tax=Candidatus Bathycorpusculum sp. TaxID=2994959 RepID=UPI00282DAB02|nr:basic secretory family protein [Candidatus Termitimicrobium sp.]MDR0493493.1 basic secretory family protein [Nitrososphaerota archaeon]
MKRKIIGVTVLFIIFAILGSLLVLERPQNSDLTAYEVQAQKIFEEAKSQFEGIRNVTLPPNIKLSVYTKQQAVDRWGKDPSGVDTVSVLRQENIYKSLFLIAENDSLGGVTAEWTTGWMAASVGNEIYVIYENFWPWDMPDAIATLIHELTHVWQSGLPASTSHDTDRAHSALVEGDAAYMADYYRAQYNNRINSEDSEYNNRLPVFIDSLRLNSVQPSVPDAVTELNWFSYIKGKTFVAALIDDGGWDRLNHCYIPAHTPSTTTQIIHPDKYFAGKTAKPTLTPTPVDDNWTRIPSRYGFASDSYGEYFIYVMLSRWLNDSQAQQVASGWSGDSFTYYEKGSDFMFTWNITWNSVQNASEFNQTFRDMLNLAQANLQGIDTWFTNGKYLTLTWDPNAESTLIVCSTNQAATEASFFNYQSQS